MSHRIFIVLVTFFFTHPSFSQVDPKVLAAAQRFHVFRTSLELIGDRNIKRLWNGEFHKPFENDPILNENANTFRAYLLNGDKKGVLEIPFIRTTSHHVVSKSLLPESLFMTRSQITHREFLLNVRKGLLGYQVVTPLEGRFEFQSDNTVAYLDPETFVLLSSFGDLHYEVYPPLFEPTPGPYDKRFVLLSVGFKLDGSLPRPGGPTPKDLAINDPEKFRRFRDATPDTEEDLIALGKAVHSKWPRIHTIIPYTQDNLLFMMNFILRDFYEELTLMINSAVAETKARFQKAKARTRKEKLLQATQDLLSTLLDPNNRLFGYLQTAQGEEYLVQTLPIPVKYLQQDKASVFLNAFVRAAQNKVNVYRTRSTSSRCPNEILGQTERQTPPQP